MTPIDGTTQQSTTGSEAHVFSRFIAGVSDADIYRVSELDDKVLHLGLDLREAQTIRQERPI